LSAQIHVPASKSFVGVWRQTGRVLNTGAVIPDTTGNLKVINPNKTDYTILKNGNRGAVIGFYATPVNNGKDFLGKFKLINEKTLRSDWEMGDRWVGEIWTRVEVADLHQYEME
jgi:hypothetical protein